MKLQNKSTFLDDPRKLLRLSLIFLGSGIILVLGMPIMFTKMDWLVHFSEKDSWIGDAIGGTTGPIVSLIGAILVSLSLYAQVKANQDINDRVTLQDEYQERKDNYHTLKDLYNEVIQRIHGFEVKNNTGYYNTHLKGIEALDYILKEISIKKPDDVTITRRTEGYPQLMVLLELTAILCKQMICSNLDDMQRNVLFHLISLPVENNILKCLPDFRLNEHHRDKYWEISWEMIDKVNQIRESFDQMELRVKDQVHG